jgi:hypothetical protein
MGARQDALDRQRPQYASRSGYGRSAAQRNALELARCLWPASPVLPAWTFVTENPLPASSAADIAATGIPLRQVLWRTRRARAS